MRADLVRRVVSTVVDFDMHNLFPPKPWVEYLEEAASGDYTVQPRRTLRERQYTPDSVLSPEELEKQKLKNEGELGTSKHQKQLKKMLLHKEGKSPLIVKPKYQGDFLDKLREKETKEGASDYNLLDFSMPSEMLKHQEEPIPRDMAEETFEHNRPGPGVGQKTLKDYSDRGWGRRDSPEMSEDKILRMRIPPKKDQKTFKLPLLARIIEAFNNLEHPPESGPSSNNVVANFIMETAPAELELDINRTKTAELLSDLQGSKITTKSKGTRPIDLNLINSVNVTPIKAEPRSGRWTFSTSSPGGKGSYRTVFQFIPAGNVRDPNKLHVRVNCTCPSFLFWGAQYNAIRGNYLYGRIRPKFSPPTTRDPEGLFIACKHILACSKLILSPRSIYKIVPSKALVNTSKKDFKFEMEKSPDEKLHIPAELLQVGRRKKVRDLAVSWKDLNTRQRTKAIKGLTDPDEIYYLAHRFPQTATAPVAKRMVELSKIVKDKVDAKKIEKDLGELEEIMGENLIPVKPKMPPSLSKLDKSSQFQNSIKGWDLLRSQPKKRKIYGMDDPDELAYMAYKFHGDDDETVSYVIEKLDHMSKTDPDEANREKADKWSQIIY